MSRSPRSLSAVLLLVLAVAMPVQAAPVDGKVVQLTGDIADVHFDTFAGEVRHEIHLVLGNGTSVVLDLPAYYGHPTPGQAMTARGVLSGQRLAVEVGGLRKVDATPFGSSSSASAGASSGTAAAADGTTVAAGGSGTSSGTGTTTTATGTTVAAVAPVTKTIAVLLINFVDDTTETYTKANVASSFFGAPPVKSVATFYSEQSYGAWTTVGDVYGYFTVTRDPTTCNWSDWGLQARNQATAAGINLGNYTNVVHVWRGQGTCGWSGLAYLPGTLSFLNGTTSLHVATHELGHNYGAHHASTYNCTENGVRVAISAPANCTANEYGDPFDTMGNGSRLSHPWHRKQEAQLTTADQTTVTTAGRYVVGVANASTTLPYRIVRVPRGDGTYFYLDVRQPGGLIDNFSVTDPAVQGVFIRLNPDTTITQSRLIDATPATTSFNDATLLPGQTFYDPISTVSITTVSVDGSAGATVDVSWGPDTTPPSGVGTVTGTNLAGPSVRLAWSAATDDRGVAGYRVTRDGTTMTTATGTTWTDSAVVAGTTYVYTVSAVDTSGNVGPASTATVVVPVPDTTAPTAPSSLTVTSLSGGKVRLDWKAATDNVAVTGYRVYDGTKLLASPGASTLSYTYNPPRGTHSWSVKAIDAAGNLSTASNTLTYQK